MTESRPPGEDPAQTKRDIRAALAFGIVAATIEMVLLVYFFW